MKRFVHAFVVILALGWIAAGGVASASTRELLIRFDVPDEFAPKLVCMHVEKLGKDLACLRDRDALADLPGPKPDCDETVSRPRLQFSAPACGKRADSACYSCKSPPVESYAVCVGDVDLVAGRTRPNRPTLQLQLENVGLEALALEGRNLRLSVDYPESAAVTARVEVLGGTYHAGRVSSVQPGEDLTLGVVPLCVSRTLTLPVVPESGCALERLTSNGGAPEKREIRKGAPYTLRVNESGLDNTVSLWRCGTVFEGKFSYPPPPTLPLSPRVFDLRWHPHCLVTPQGTLRGCPSATLIRYGHECTPLSPMECSPGQCCYQCRPPEPVEFPTTVRFEMKPEPAEISYGDAEERQGHDTSLDPVQWSEEMRFPGDELSGFVAVEQRRIFFRWPSPVDDSRDWKERGAEIDALEVTAPDGRVQRVGRGTLSLAVPGLQCDDRFVYRYQGRWPDRARGSPLQGDTLVVGTSTDRQQTIVIGLRAHAGALAYSQVPPDARWSPFFDVELAGLVFGGLDLAFSGIFSEHPSVTRSPDAKDEWDASPLARVLFGVGYRWYWHERVYFMPAIAGGIAFPALASDWGKAREYPIAAARARFAYEISRATSIDLGFWLFWPEQYMSTTQDAAGPTETASRLATVGGLSAGFQWADLF